MDFNLTITEVLLVAITALVFAIGMSIFDVLVEILKELKKQNNG